MRDTDVRQGRAIAQAVLDALPDGDLKSEGLGLLETEPLDWGAILTWNRRACEFLYRNKTGYRESIPLPPLSGRSNR